MLSPTMYLPATICSRVVLPAPLAPTNRQREPRGRSRGQSRMKGSACPGYLYSTSCSLMPLVDATSGAIVLLVCFKAGRRRGASVLGASVAVAVALSRRWH